MKLQLKTFLIFLLLIGIIAVRGLLPEGVSDTVRNGLSIIMGVAAVVLYTIWMRCPHCGRSFRPHFNKKFCSYCGKEIYNKDNDE